MLRRVSGYCGRRSAYRIVDEQHPTRRVEFCYLCAVPQRSYDGEEMILQFLISASVSLTWDPSVSPEVVKYYIYEKSELQSDFVKVANTTGLTITIPVKPMLQMQYAATAADVNEVESEFSNIVSYLRPATLAIRQFRDGPLLNLELSTDVYAGLNYTIEATRDFLTWESVGTGTASTDALVVPFNMPNEPHLFFRLKKNVAQQMTLTRSLYPMGDIEPLSYNKPTAWQMRRWKIRNAPKDIKGAELLMTMNKRRPDVVPPPMPLRVRNE